MTERDPYTRGWEDLPTMLQQWVAVNPRWRLVRIVPCLDPDAGGLIIQLTELDPAASEDRHSRAWAESWEPEAMAEAVLDVVHDYGLHFGR